MTKRGFLKSMLLAAVAPQVLVAAAEDRYRWKMTTEWRCLDGMAFKPGGYNGMWAFVQYHRLPSGLWVKSGTGIDGVAACSEHDISLCNQWEALHPKPHVEMCLPAGDAEMIFRVH